MQMRTHVTSETDGPLWRVTPGARHEAPTGTFPRSTVFTPRRPRTGNRW